MNLKVLIFVDRLVKPFYRILNVLKWRGKVPEEFQHFTVLKFFGLGSITRIVHVMDVVGISKESVTFITLHKNKAVIDLLGLQAMYVKTKNPLVLAISIYKLVVHVWRQKQTTILDMERISNLSGLFRLMIGIGKHCRSFYFKPKNAYKRGQFFVSLHSTPATKAIAEMFNKTYVSASVKYDKKVDTNKIYININAGEYLLQRRFTLPEYAILIKTLHDKNPDWHFYLTGVASEYAFVELFKERLIKQGVSSNQITVIAGQHNLSAFVTNLKEAKLFVTNDSGPLHLAYLFGVRTVGIWGPTSSTLVGYENSKLMLNFDSEIPCSPCFRHPKSKVAKACHGSLTCFKSRNPMEMATKIIRFVE